MLKGVVLGAQTSGRAGEAQDAPMQAPERQGAFPLAPPPAWDMPTGARK